MICARLQQVAHFVAQFLFMRRCFTPNLLNSVGKVLRRRAAVCPAEHFKVRMFFEAGDAILVGHHIQLEHIMFVLEAVISAVAP